MYGKGVIYFFNGIGGDGLGYLVEMVMLMEEWIKCYNFVGVFLCFLIVMNGFFYFKSGVKS